MRMAIGSKRTGGIVIRRVSASSRLHFGLLHVPESQEAKTRAFGGCGVMIDPGSVQVQVQPSTTWRCKGAHADRALQMAQSWTQQPHQIQILHCPEQHVGLGIGTALSLSLAKALFPELTLEELARRTGRGRRSGVGIHGFEHGGVIIDAGRSNETDLPILIGQIPFPADWRIVLILPKVLANWHGSMELAAFHRRRDSGAVRRISEQLSRILLWEMWPNLLQVNHPNFAEALYDYNRISGEFFADDQQGTYSDPTLAAWIRRIRDWGFAGVGQSSWGPTLFAICANDDEAMSLKNRVELCPLPFLQCRIVFATNESAEYVQDSCDEANQPNISR